MDTSDVSKAGGDSRGSRPRKRTSNAVINSRAKLASKDRPASREEQVPSKPNSRTNSPIALAHANKENAVNGRYVVILQPVDKDTRFINDLKVRRDILAITSVTHVHFLRYGGLAAVVDSREAEKLLLETTSVGNIAVSASLPKSETTCKGVIRHVTPGVTCEDVFNELKFANDGLPVLHVKRLGKGPSNTYCVTLEGRTLPASIYLGFWKHNVKNYEEGPSQCFNCQRWNHSSHQCRGKPRCVHCSGPHALKSCDSASKSAPPVCSNCKGTHPSFSRKCPVRDIEGKLHNIKRTDHISYAEALARPLRPGFSFAQALASAYAPSSPPIPPRPSTCSIGVGTDSSMDTATPTSKAILVSSATSTDSTEPIPSVSTRTVGT